MKLVIQQYKNTIVRDLREFELVDTINSIKSNYSGIEKSPLNHELFRFKLYNKGVILIYKNNKRRRSRDLWYEIRGLTNLSRLYNGSFFHGVRLNFKHGLKTETEIDGLDTETQKVMVEIKNMTLTQEWADFYEKKRKRLEMKECFIIVPNIAEKIRFSPKIRCFIFNPDFETLMDYYNNDFSLPSWLTTHIRWRHLRILLSNGNWHGIKRKLTKTAKHTPSSKLIQTINNVSKNEKYPIKIYYSLCPMLIPVDEYFGQGRPLPRVIAALDIDSDHQNHIIGPKGYCLKCLEGATEKAQLISKKLNDTGWNFLKLYSGSKGYHFYLLDKENDKNIVQFPDWKFLDFIETLKDEEGNFLVDNVNFRAKDGSFDSHRIFKLPNSVDATTGILVKKNFTQLNFKDKIIELN